MDFNTEQVRRYLEAFDLKVLFEELGWEGHHVSIPLSIDDTLFVMKGVAEKRGVQIFACVSPQLPDYPTRRKLEHELTKTAFEHLIIFTDEAETTQIWQWVDRQPGRPAAYREHPYYRGHAADALVQRLRGITFTLQEEEAGIDITAALVKLRDAFDKEPVTKKFYDRFKREHSAFLEFTQGIREQGDREWYVSVMLNRLMFVYFIQQKGFLDGDPRYLQNRLGRVRQQQGNDKFHSFYRHFLLRLFHEGLGGKARNSDLDALLGRVPYLNGGLFDEHVIEARYEAIHIPDEAFERIFAFFDDFRWHLDERPMREQNEINPDVLGYIFEKYINQKQMGAYYTKEDITEYISKNTIIPFVLDSAHKGCRIAFEGEASVWKLLQRDPDRYIYGAVKKGADLPLPPEIEAGMADVSKRGTWNTPAPESYALPTEIWREVVARRQRYGEVRAKLENGEVSSASDLITYNLDIRQFVQDVIETSEGPELLRAVWKAVQSVTVLDPTCGSGAFLFAALNILQPLYEACLTRMEGFVTDLERNPPANPPALSGPPLAKGGKGEAKFSDFRKVLVRVAEHPNRDYFVLKSIILNNLYGVDIMEEAVEIAKLRLFLKLVAQVEEVRHLEPLPDIDFNIRAGNTLVGYATYDEVQQAVEGKWGKSERIRLDLFNAMDTIKEKAQAIDRLFKLFKQQQTDLGGEVTPEDKQELRRRLKELEDELNVHLARDYGITVEKKAEFEAWRTSHQPFHWFTEFYGIMSGGGFDVIIGNPPYVELKALSEYSPVGYTTERAGNLYALVMERCLTIRGADGWQGYIVPVSSVSTDRYDNLQTLIERFHLYYSSFDDRPSRLFDGLEHIRLTIHLIGKPTKSPQLYSTLYHKWTAVEREALFAKLRYTCSSSMLIDKTLPKLSNVYEVSILNKLKQQRNRLNHFYIRSNSYAVYYSRKVGYFLQVLDFAPRVFDGQGNLRPPSEFKELNFQSFEHSNISLGALNSNLFYWFITVFSDCRHVNKREVDAFPIDLDELAKSEYAEQIIVYLDC